MPANLSQPTSQPGQSIHSKEQGKVRTKKQERERAFILSFYFFLYLTGEIMYNTISTWNRIAWHGMAWMDGILHTYTLLFPSSSSLSSRRRQQKPSRRAYRERKIKLL
jgi:hypothetical protein